MHQRCITVVKYWEKQDGRSIGCTENGFRLTLNVDPIQLKKCLAKLQAAHLTAISFYLHSPCTLRTGPQQSCALHSRAFLLKPSLPNCLGTYYSKLLSLGHI